MQKWWDEKYHEELIMIDNALCNKNYIIVYIKNNKSNA